MESTPLLTRFWRETSLLTRTNIILGVSAMLIAAIATAALYRFVIDPIMRQSANDEAALLVLSAQTWVELPPDARPYFELEMAETHDLIISEALQDLPVVDVYDPYFDFLRGALQLRLAREEPVSLLAGDDDLYWVDVPMADTLLQIGFSPQRQDIQPLYGAIVIFGLGALIVFMSSLFIVQRIARPLVSVAHRAEEFRGSGEFEPLPETGPRELASLARNFNTMAAEVSALLDNRTTLLAGVSHDLRTPLTRMRLALALLTEQIQQQQVDEGLLARFERNLEDMDSLIENALRFARGTHESAQRVDVLAMVAELVKSYPAQDRVSMESKLPHLFSELAPSAFTRVLSNLLDNATHFGEQVHVSVLRDCVVVADDGPGIPDHQHEEIFQPFFRVETSRSTATGGSGLGLAIVDQLCQAHGWRIEVDRSRSLGGAEFRLYPNGSAEGEIS